jgi:hypothetical protein
MRHLQAHEMVLLQPSLTGLISSSGTAPIPPTLHSPKPSQHGLPQNRGIFWEQQCAQRDHPKAQYRQDPDQTAEDKESYNRDAQPSRTRPPQPSSGPLREGRQLCEQAHQSILFKMAGRLTILLCIGSSLRGGTDPESFEKVEKVGKLNELPVNHSPDFAPVIEPTLRVGIEAMLAAASVWLVGEDAKA